MLNTFKLHTHKEYADLQSDRDSLIAKCQGLETEVENLKKMSVEMADKQAQHENVIAQLKDDGDKAIAELKAHYEQTISDLQNQVKVEASSSESKAIATLAKIGVPVDELPQAKAMNDSNPIKQSFRVIPFINNQ